MATAFWTPNAVATAQVDALLGAGTPAAGNVITAIMGASATSAGKPVSYTLISTDTLATAISALVTLLSAAGPTVPEFSEATYAVDANNSSRIVVTAQTAGTPFTLSASSSGGGMTLTWSNVTPNSSPSDVANTANWLRAGVQALPQSGDTIIVAGSSVGMLWNVGALAAVAPADYQRYQSMAGQIGLPDTNPLGYVEYRPTRLTFSKTSSSSSSSSGPGATLTCELGLGPAGPNPPLERYDVGGTATTWTVLAGNTSAAGLPYAVDVLNTSSASTLTAVGAGVGWAAQPTQTGAILTATLDGGASLAVGPNVTFSGKLTVTQGTAYLQSAPAALLAQQGSQITVGANNVTFPSVQASGGSTVTWPSNANVVSLTLQTGSTFDKSGDVRPITVTSSTIDGDCVINDPHNAISYSKPTLVTGAVTSGPFPSGAGRTVQLV